MRSEDRDSAGNVTESESLLERRDADVLVVGEVGDEEAASSAEVLRGTGGPEIEEGEGTGEGKGEGGESAPEGGGESGEDQAEGSQEISEGREEKGQEGSESEAEGGGGGPDQRGEVVFCRVDARQRRCFMCDSITYSKSLDDSFDPVGTEDFEYTRDPTALGIRGSRCARDFSLSFIIRAEVEPFNRVCFVVMNKWSVL